MALVLALTPAMVVSETQDQRCLALNIYYEARGQAVTDQQAVGHVTLNRVKSPKWPKTICSVVHQSGQFSWTRDGRSDIPSNPKALAEAKRIANQVLDGELEDNTDGATYFYNYHMAKPPVRKYQVTLVTRHHKYLKV